MEEGPEGVLEYLVRQGVAGRHVRSTGPEIGMNIIEFGLVCNVSVIMT